MNITIKDNDGLAKMLSSDIKSRLHREQLVASKHIASAVVNDLRHEAPKYLSTIRPSVIKAVETERDTVGVIDNMYFNEILPLGYVVNKRRVKFIAVPVNGGPGVSPSSVISKASGRFIKTIHGTLGIWEPRGKKHVKLLYRLEARKDDPYIPFDRLVEQSASQHHYEQNLYEVLDRVIK